MFPVAYLYCERCNERRLFIVMAEAPPIDENLALCEVCGFSFGYCVRQEWQDNRVVDVPRPVLDPEVMRAGVEAYRAERTAQLLAGGTTIERLTAQRQLEQALANSDVAERRRLTMPTQRGGLDADLAAKVLSPSVPGNRSGGKPVE